MRSNVVNRLKFDFTCSTEDFVGTLQPALMSFTLPGIEAVISEVLQEQEDAPDQIIDCITIELGNIGPADLNDARLLEKFKVAFSEQVFASRRQLTKMETEHGDVAWVIVQQFLLTGDVPWWVEKESLPDLNRLLQKAMAETPEQVRSFMARYGRRSKIRHRIRSQFSAANIRILLASEDIFADPWLEAENAGHQDVLEFLAQIANGSIDNSLKLLLFITVLRHDEMLEVLQKAVATWLDQENSLMVEKLESGRNALNRIEEVLQKLTLPQVSFIHQAALRFKTNKPKSTKIPVSPAKKRRIAAIANILKWDSPALLEALTKCTNQHLSSIEKTLQQYKKNDFVRREMVRLIVSDPDYFKRDLLLVAEKIFASSVWSVSTGAFEGKEAKESAQRQFICSILDRACQYKEGDSALLKRTLVKLPDHVLQLLAGLSYLDKQSFDEVARVVDVNAIEDDDLEPTLGQSVNAEEKKFILENAGLVLLAPYFPGLFRNLGYLEGNSFKNTDYQIRAMYLVQYIVNRTHTCPEYLLQLNKILCGIEPEHVVPRNKRRLNKKEQEEAKDLILSAINNWKALRNTSPEGFRSAFLKRKGLMLEHTAHWALQLEKKAYDVLLSELPWSFSLIKLPWMNKPIEVEW